MLARTSSTMAEAWGVLKELSADDSARMRAEARDKARMDYKTAVGSAHKKGLQKGEQKVLQKLVRNALRDKMPLKTISRLAGQPLKEIKQLAASLTD